MSRPNEPMSKCDACHVQLQAVLFLHWPMDGYEVIRNAKKKVEEEHMEEFVVSVMYSFTD